MTHQEELMLATLKGISDGYVTIAKAYVRAAFAGPTQKDCHYALGYRNATCHKAVEYLRDMRGIQRAVHEYCKGVGYHAAETPTP